MRPPEAKERFDADFLRRLEALRFALRRRVAGGREGDRPSGRPGGAAVHLAHRPYTQGEDIRAIDWHVYARLGELFVREREREEAVRLHVVIDGSASMRVGGKLRLAARLAAALGVIVEAEGGEAVLWVGPPQKLTLEGLDRFTEGPPASTLLRGLPPRALAVVVTDPWDEPHVVAPATLVHVLAPEELEPAMRGMTRLVDSESGEVVDRFVGPEEVTEYQRLLGECLAGWKTWAHRRDVAYVRCTSDVPFSDLIKVFIGEGVLE